MTINNAFITGALCNLLYLKGLPTNIDTSKASIIPSFEVVVAAFMGVFIFSEGMNWFGLIGMISMIASIYLMN